MTSCCDELRLAVRFAPKPNTCVAACRRSCDDPRPGLAPRKTTKTATHIVTTRKVKKQPTASERMVVTNEAPADMSAGLQALLDHVVTAEVKDLDHYRTHGGVSVETDYIVEVCAKNYNKESLPKGRERIHHKIAPYRTSN